KISPIKTIQQSTRSVPILLHVYAIYKEYALKKIKTKITDPYKTVSEKDKSSSRWLRSICTTLVDAPDW
ncbi:2047_t:CDS:2, partial [Racocetra persica]